MTDLKSKTGEQLSAMAAEIKAALSPGEIVRLMRLIEPTPTTGEMSAEEYELLVKELEPKGGRRAYSEKSLKAARLVLVMGANVAEAAASTNLTRQSVNQLMQRIRRRMESMPDGWQQFTDWFPSQMVPQLESISAQLKELHSSGVPIDGACSVVLSVKP